VRNRGRYTRFIALGGLVLLVVCLFFGIKPVPDFSEPELEERPASAQPSPTPEPSALELTPAPRRVVIPNEPQPPTLDPADPRLLREDDLPLVRCSISSDLQLPDTEVTVFEQSPGGATRWIMLDGQIQAGTLEFRSQKLTSHGSVTIPNVGQFPLDWQGDSCTLVLTEPTYVAGKLNPPPPSDMRVTVGGCGAFTDEFAEDGAFTLNVTETERCRLVVRADKIRLEEVYLTPDAGNELELDIEVSDYERTRGTPAPQ
jgi:hypothetical protein